MCLFCQFVLQVNKVSLSLCHALSGSLQVLSNHNNWSHRLAGGNKGTSVCCWQERLREILLASALHSNHCHAVILRNTEHYCVLHVSGLCLNNLRVRIFLHIWLFMPSWLYIQADMQFIIRYCTAVVFSPQSPLRRLYPWMRDLFGFSSAFPLCTVTPVLLSVSWPGHTAVFFPL